MKWARHSRTRFSLAVIALAVAVVTLVARLSRISRDGKQRVLTWSKSQPQAATEPDRQRPPTPEDNSANPLFTGTPVTSTPAPSSAPLPNNQPAQIPADTPSSLIIPVAGVRPDQLRDTFSEARSEGRVHDAIDIPAPRGTPVLAAADGPIVKLFQNKRGGTTIYQASVDGKFIYYYAHLERYAEGLTEGHFVKQGEIIAYVGDTGNAEPGNYHLHFSIAVTSNPKRYWEGVNINPYPLLKR